ncbi:MAG: hypothetical protein SGI91_17880 [Alphaproteobacteria bacterium]|nr:hypothetical protein [Alphaproteobacteria bacterium]
MFSISRATGVAMVVFVSIVIGAAAPTPTRAWDCWFSADGTKRDVTVIRLIQEGRVLMIRGAEFIEYTIMEDNDVGLVAVISYAEGKHLGADVMVIDKATLEFRKTNVFTDALGADNNPKRGKCVQKKA